MADTKESVSATEFLRWVKLFEEEWSDKTPLLYYLAQIAFQVYLCRYMLGGTPDKSLEDFLIPFNFTDRTEQEVKADREKLKADMKVQQQMMLANLLTASSSVAVQEADLSKSMTFR